MIEFGGIARRTHVAHEPDVTAKRKPTDLPARPLPVGPADDLAPEPYREHFGRDLEHPRNEIVAELVEENEWAKRAVDRGLTKSASSRASSTILTMSVKPSLPSRKCATATSFAALSTVGAAPPFSSASRARRNAGKRSMSGFSKSRRAIADKSKRSAGVSIRSGQASA